MVFVGASKSLNLANGFPFAITHTGQVIEGSFTSTSVLVFLDGSAQNSGMYVGSFSYVGAAITSTSIATSYSHNSSTLNFSISGISISVGTYFSFLDVGNGIGLRQYLLSGDDSINGSIFNDVLYGDAGNDSMHSNGGNDVLYGGSGNDSIVGGTGNEFLYGEEGDDTIFSGDGDDTIEGGAGNDNIDAGTGLNIVDAGSGDDTVQGQSRQVFGGDGNDTITVGLVADFADGGNGNDFVSGFGLLRGGSGDDILTSPSTFDVGVTYSMYGGSGIDTMNGGASKDLLFGDEGNDHLLGGAADDVLDGGSGADRMEGGQGDDEYLVDDAQDVVTEQSQQGDDTVSSSVSFVIPSNVETLVMTGTGNINATGSDEADHLTGNQGNNSLLGGAGRDVLRGESGNDLLDGQTGLDTLHGGAGDDIYVIADLDGPDSTFVTFHGDPNETLTLGQSFSYESPATHIQPILQDIGLDGIVDTLYVSVGDWQIQFTTRSLGVSLQVGVYENAQLAPGQQNGHPGLSFSGLGNSMSNATGRFEITQIELSGTTLGKFGATFEIHASGAPPGVYGEVGINVPRNLDTPDEVVENANEGTDRVRSAVTYELPNHVEQLELTGSGAIDGTGNSLDNLIVGNSADNVLLGAGGADTLRGEGGDDTLFGGASNDYFDGGLGTDTVSYAQSAFGVAVSLSLGVSAATNGASDTLVDVENVIGSPLSDVLIGYIGVANSLNGGDGDDYLFFDDLDAVTGGTGTDRAVVLGADGVMLTMSDIEWLWGSNAADVADASSQTATVTIFGMGGVDTLTGGSGDDQLYGQDGADALSGGEGDDWLYIDSQDIAGGNVQGGGGADRAASLDGSALAFDLGASSIEWVWASNLGDDLDGSTQTNGLFLFSFDGTDTLRGGSGNDSLYGMAGADAMYGGDGNDVLYFDSDDTMVDGGGDHDTAQVLDYTGVGVTLNLASRQIEVVYASNQSDVLDAGAATWAVYMNGYNGDDVMSGGSGDDNIYGGGGADSLSGGGGNDFLDAGGGPDLDTLIVNGANVEYILHYTGGHLTSVQDLVGGRDGWDNVAGFERIQFSSGILDL